MIISLRKRKQRGCLAIGIAALGVLLAACGAPSGREEETGGRGRKERGAGKRGEKEAGRKKVRGAATGKYPRAGGALNEMDAGPGGPGNLIHCLIIVHRIGKKEVKEFLSADIMSLCIRY